MFINLECYFYYFLSSFKFFREGKLQAVPVVTTPRTATGGLGEAEPPGSAGE